jgi:hypothetical protein
MRNILESFLGFDVVALAAAPDYGVENRVARSMPTSKIVYPPPSKTVPNKR